MSKLVIYASIAAGAVCLMAYLGVSQSLGAHPFWSVKVALYGAIPGALLALGLAWLTRFAVYFAVLDLSLAAVVAWWGKRIFVTSSGDNALGGQMWFFGWIAVCACAVAVLALLARRLLK